MAQTINPPPTCTAGIETPKISSTYAPIRIEPASTKKLLIETSRAVFARSSGVSELTMAR